MRELYAPTHRLLTKFDACPILISVQKCPAKAKGKPTFFNNSLGYHSWCFIFLDLSWRYCFCLLEEWGEEDTFWPFLSVSVTGSDDDVNEMGVRTLRDAYWGRDASKYVLFWTCLLSRPQNRCTLKVMWGHWRNNTLKNSYSSKRNTSELHRP